MHAIIIILLCLICYLSLVLSPVLEQPAVQNDMLLAELELFKLRLRLAEDNLKTARGVGSHWPAEPAPASSTSDPAKAAEIAVAAIFPNLTLTMTVACSVELII